MTEYQSETTLALVSIADWSYATKVDPRVRFLAAHTAAVHIAEWCEIDLVSFAPFAVWNGGDAVSASAVYANKGRALDEIHSLIKAGEGRRDKTASYWRIHDSSAAQGFIFCIVQVKGDDEKW
jgi:hypothetical protein